MQISKTRFRQLIREEVENYLLKEQQSQRDDAKIEARIRLLWLKETFLKKYNPKKGPITIHDLSYREEDYRKLYNELKDYNLLGKPPAKGLKESVLMEAPPRDAGGRGGLFPTEYDRSETRRYEKEYGSHKERPLPGHHLPDIRKALEFTKKHGPWNPNSCPSDEITFLACKREGKKDWIPGPTGLVCTYMRNLIGEGFLTKDIEEDNTSIIVRAPEKVSFTYPEFIINEPTAFHRVCLDPRRSAVDEQPPGIWCGDFKKEKKAWEDDRQTKARQRWTEQGIINPCNWPIPSYGLVFTNAAQRAIPLVYMNEVSHVLDPAATDEEDISKRRPWEVYFNSDRTQTLMRIENKIAYNQTLEAEENEWLYAAMWTPGGFYPALTVMAARGLWNWAVEEEKEITKEQQDYFRKQIYGRDVVSPVEIGGGLPPKCPEVPFGETEYVARGLNCYRRPGPIDPSANIEEKPSWSERLKKFGCTLPPHTRPLTSFDLEQYEISLLEKPWDEKEGDEFQSYVQNSTGRVGGSDDLVKQYRIWKLLGSSDASNYIPGKWPTTPAVQRLLKDFRRGDDWNKFEQCMRKSPLFKQEYGDVPVGFLTAPPSPEKKEIESCIERFGDTGKQRAIRDKDQEYRRRTGKSLPVPTPAGHGAAPRIMNQRCLQMLCSNGNKLACKTLKK